MMPTINIGDLLDSFDFTQPTRRCIICDVKENPDAKYVDLGKAWMCKTCKRKLRGLIGIDGEDVSD